MPKKLEFDGEAFRSFSCVNTEAGHLGAMLALTGVNPCLGGVDPLCRAKVTHLALCVIVCARQKVERKVREKRKGLQGIRCWVHEQVCRLDVPVYLS